MRLTPRLSYGNPDDYFRTMSQARVDNSLNRIFRSFLAPDLLILDDLGPHRFTAQQSADLYDLILNRHRASSFVITSNRAVDEWLSLFDGSCPTVASPSPDPPLPTPTNTTARRHEEITNDPKHDLTLLLKHLKLGAMFVILPQRIALVCREQLDHASFLEIILSDETYRRAHRRLA